MHRPQPGPTGRRLRVAMLTNLFPPVVSGSSTQVSGLSRELVRAGHEVLVVTAQIDPSWPQEELRDGYRVLRLPSLRLPKVDIALNFPWLNLTATPPNVLRLSRALREFAPDLLHVHNHMFDFALLGSLLGPRLGVPTVLTIHTVIRHSQPRFDRILCAIDRHFLGPAVVRRASLVLCPDAEVARYVDETFAPGQRLIVPYGIDPLADARPDEIAALRRKYGLDGCEVILSLGHCHALRDRYELIHAMPRILAQRPDVRLLVLGALTSEEPRRWCEQLGITDQVRFAGAIAHAEVPAHLGLGTIECHWLNNQDPEHNSLGIATLEAMLLGRVVIAAASAAAYGPGVLSEGRDFLGARARDPEGLAALILALLADPDRCRRIAESARRVVRTHFSWRGILARTLSAYARALGQGADGLAPRGIATEAGAHSEPGAGLAESGLTGGSLTDPGRG